MLSVASAQTRDVHHVEWRQRNATLSAAFPYNYRVTYEKHINPFIYIWAANLACLWRHSQQRHPASSAAIGCPINGVSRLFLAAANATRPDAGVIGLLITSQIADTALPTGTLLPGNVNIIGKSIFRRRKNRLLRPTAALLMACRDGGYTGCCLPIMPL